MTNRLTSRRYGELLNKFGGLLKQETKGQVSVTDDEKKILSAVVNSLQVVVAVSSSLVRELREAGERSVDLDAAARRCAEEVARLRKGA
jgi:hypothetical protein